MCRSSRRVRRARGFALRRNATETTNETDVVATRGGPDTVEERVSVLFPYVAGSAAFMAAWVFGPFPGSLYTGIPSHDEFIGQVYDVLHFTPVFGPASLITKYNELGRIPALTHALPGALWCALSAWQLHPASREKFDGAAHRWGGRAMLAAAAALMVGYAFIDANGLPADVHDFHGHSGAIADALDTALHAPTPVNTVDLRILAGWFVFTGINAGVTARDGDVERHKVWALRHVAAGLWVAAQRPVYSAMRTAMVTGGFLGLVDDASGVESLADGFYYASYLTTSLYFVSAEWAARGRGERQERTEVSE